MIDIVDQGLRPQPNVNPLFAESPEDGNEDQDGKQGHLQEIER
jgi:hypothetical protein